MRRMMEVRSGVPQGMFWDHFFLLSSLMTLMNMYFVNISKFANDIKIASRVNTLNGVKSLQRTLDKLFAWSKKWEMKFNINKCGALHIGKINFKFQYQMNDGWVKLINEKKDLGVITSKDLKFSRQCLLA